ncbi:hypothetical protein Afe04nite_21960 [Asanoa ferruginea]|nr:hypothetical protein Afe04nite_21960 [Asanoa ferruginea]
MRIEKSDGKLNARCAHIRASVAARRVGDKDGTRSADTSQASGDPKGSGAKWAPRWRGIRMRNITVRPYAQ